MKNEPKIRIVSVKLISIQAIWVLILFLSFSLSGCGTGPRGGLIERETKVVSEFDLVWESILTFFSKHNVEITTSDKESGLIIIDSENVPPEWIDCGESGLLRQILSSSGEIQVEVSTEWNWDVTIKVKTTVEALVYFKFKTTDDKQVISCYATGVLGNLLFHEIYRTALTEDDSVENQSTNYGTGFFIAPTGEIVTCYHLVKDKKQIWIKHQVRERLLEAKVIAVDEKNDIAILRPTNLSDLPQGIIGDIPYRLRKTFNLKVDSNIFILRYPLADFADEEIIYKEGVILGDVDTNTTSRIFQFSIPIWYGNSGAPVMTDSGYIIGMAVPTTDVKQFAEFFGTIPPNTNFAVKSDYINSLLNSIPHTVILTDKPSFFAPNRLSKYIVAIKAK